MSETPAISVIMPVYNTGKYLREAVDSVLAQTFTDFELLLIDDGSTDGSAEVCDEYSARDRRVRVKHGRNGGICASRNAGIALAEGEWLAFCDHDDFVLPDWLGRMFGAVADTDYDIVKCNHRWEERSAAGRRLRMYPPVKMRDRAWTTEDFRAEGGYALYRALGSLIWDGLYRRSFWLANGLKFDESFRYGCEDLNLSIDLLQCARRGLWLEEALYIHYFNHATSTSAHYHTELADDYVRVLSREQELVTLTDGVRCDQLLFWSRMAFYYLFSLRGRGARFSECDRVLLRLRSAAVGNVRVRATGRTVVRRAAAWLLLRGHTRAYLLLLRLRLAVKRLRQPAAPRHRED